ncbi:right-handed parallel beta-helix repeat-containing protein [Maritimibacter sp. DP07]|uniref:Right-handed parallel beta-helix repeat-containing protein n=1 Tax=Maritimibacter harenae TaxID=2606218 RepID=A0A845LUS1_9RHOB|nr:NosD domain-containing protein [Maritimibacter harenae]MZR11565.1 right-handed parallel beta-helix repeat-containing protein [Maritimibacter harenae]
MASQNCYDVTQWPVGDPHEDVGAVINSIIADIKRRQDDPDRGDGGKPGAVIHIPPGDFRLRTQVVIDISFLRITGAGHGFTSSSIRFNTSREELAKWHELWPGGSRVLVDLPPAHGADGAAFLVAREGDPRISSVEFEGFCIDGLHFTGTEADNPENSYRNGKTGIHVASANDSFRIVGMGLVYLEHGVTVDDADALSIDNNFIAECGNCVELRGRGQASRIANNLIGAGYDGYSIFAENYGGILVTGNNVFPRGASSLYFSGVARSSVTANRFHSFYPGMLVLSDGCAENLVSSNHFFRDREPWEPMVAFDNGRDDLFGLVHIDGVNNSVIGNHLSLSIDPGHLKPAGERPVMIHVAGGTGNYIATNHVVATTEAAGTTDAPASACFATQVGALLASGTGTPLEVTTVRVGEGAASNTVLDSGTAAQVVLDRSANAFRPTPGVEAG